MSRRSFAFACIAIVLVAFVASTTAMMQKEGWHIDEIATLGLANGSIGGYITAYDDAAFGRGAFIQKVILGNSIQETISHIQGILADIRVNGLSGFSLREQYIAYCQDSTPIWKDGSEFSSYLLADGFSLGQVYMNQALDTHPPLYYLCIRGAYALWDALGQESISLWPAFGVNALFLSGICLLFLRMSKEHASSLWPGICASLCFCLSSAGLGLATYMRMYMALCFFVLWSIDGHIRLWKSGWHATKATGWQLTCSCALGFLTHYYYAIWAIACACVCLVLMGKEGQRKAILPYIGKMARGVLLSLILWPFSIVHLLLSNRSTEIMANAASALALAKGWIPVILGCFPLGAMLISVLFGGKQRNVRPLLLLCGIPAVAYTAIVFLIAPYADLRYTACALVPICLLAGVGMQKNKKPLVSALLCASLSLATCIITPPPYLYPGTKAAKAILTEHAGDPCVYLTSTSAAFFREMPDFAAYDSVIIIRKEEAGVLRESERLSSAEGFVLYVHDSISQGSAVRAIAELTGFSNITTLVESHKGLDARVYYLEK